tara:strand:+ start:583 stop:1329 length:747 start_codon:yes stop_codon:yes gene_type:complete
MSSNILKSAASAKIGKIFLNKRNEIGLSHEEITETLGINKDYIVAIESGNYHIFPSEFFARAYFKKYKEFLDIDASFPVLYKDSAKQKIVKRRSFSYIKTVNRGTLSLITLVSIFSLSFLLIINFFSFSNNSNQINIPEFEVSSENFNSIEIQVKQNNELKESKILLSNKLILDFSDECWIEIYENDEILETKLFFSGDMYERVIEQPFKIVVGDYEALKGSYNKKEIDFLVNANRLTKVNTIYFNNE